MTKFCVFKFRPSSHSEDYTLKATFVSDKDAERARRAVEQLLADMEKHPSKYKVDWTPEEAELLSGENMVWFQIYTAGYLEPVEVALEAQATPQEVKCFSNYQEVLISVRIPRDLTLPCAVLVLDPDEARAILWLTENVGYPEITDVDNSDVGEQVCEWFYEGDEIDMGDYLYLGFEFYVNRRGNWCVERQ